jgi:hypothetical protein
MNEAEFTRIVMQGHITNKVRPKPSYPDQLDTVTDFTAESSQQHFGCGCTGIIESFNTTESSIEVAVGR